MLNLPRCGVLAAVLLLLAPGASAAADELALAEAERIALERDESLARLSEQAAAVRSGAVADGALPDPEISVGYRNLPTDSFSTSQERMTMLMLGARQRFPAGQSRQLMRERGGLQAEAILADKRDRELVIQREVRGSWLDWRLAIESLEVAHALEDVFQELVEIVERRVAAGTARSRDLSQARLERSVLSERIIVLEAERDVAAAELARWLDAPVGAEMSPGEMPTWLDPAPARTIRAQFAGHPTVVAANFQVEAGSRRIDIARQAYKPQWMAELSYGYRRDDPVTDQNRPDLLSGMVSLSLPLFTGHRQDRRLDAAQREEGAARAEVRDRLRRLQGQLERAHSRWQRLDELAALYDEHILDEAQHLAESTESAYRSDRATFDELIRAHADHLDRQLRILRVRRDRAAARVELLYLEGK